MVEPPGGCPPGRGDGRGDRLPAYPVHPGSIVTLRGGIIAGAYGTPSPTGSLGAGWITDSTAKCLVLASGSPDNPVVVVTQTRQIGWFRAMAISTVPLLSIARQS